MRARENLENPLFLMELSRSLTIWGIGIQIKSKNVQKKLMQTVIRKRMMKFKKKIYKKMIARFWILKVIIAKFY